MVGFAFLVVYDRYYYYDFNSNHVNPFRRRRRGLSVFFSRRIIELLRDVYCIRKFGVDATRRGRTTENKTDERKIQLTLQFADGAKVNNRNGAAWLFNFKR